jgi:hypothetical protein
MTLLDEAISRRCMRRGRPAARYAGAAVELLRQVSPGLRSRRAAVDLLLDAPELL